MDENQPVAALSVGQLKALIRQTVQEAMAEVLIEFSLAAEYDADLTYQAEMADLIRAALQEQIGTSSDLDRMSGFDD